MFQGDSNLNSFQHHPPPTPHKYTFFFLFLLSKLVYHLLTNGSQFELTNHAKSWLIGKDWCWEGLGAGGEGDDRRWDGWMASPTRWTWVWVNSGSWWWTGRPGVLWFMASQSRTRLSDWTELNWISTIIYHLNFKIQLTLEQHGFELSRSTFTDISR